MPAFNGEPYIGAAIRSVLAQSYARWELLILDDGSADRTAEIAEAFEKSDPRIRLFRNPKNLGAAQTRNRGFALAQGEWIALLDCDAQSAGRGVRSSGEAGPFRYCSTTVRRPASASSGAASARITPSSPPKATSAQR